MTDESQRPPDLPPDTDRYIYRPVAAFRNGEIVTEWQQIWIRQP